MLENINQKIEFFWGGLWGSNPRPSEPQSDALPTELNPPYYQGFIIIIRVLKKSNHKACFSMVKLF